METTVAGHSEIAQKELILKPHEHLEKEVKPRPK